jgi:hypothetical protein
MIWHSFSLAATDRQQPQLSHLLPCKSIKQKWPLAYIDKGNRTKSVGQEDKNFRPGHKQSPDIVSVTSATSFPALCKCSEHILPRPGYILGDFQSLRQ